MAVSKKFRVPTADEIELAENESFSERPGSLFKKSKDSTLKLGNMVQDLSSNCKPSLDRHLTENKNSIPCGPVASSPKSVGTKESSSKGEGTKPSEGDSSDTTDSIIGAQESTASRTSSSNSLIVNTRQRGNPILKSVRNIPWEYGNIVPDYVMGQSNCALFLSLRYHQLHPNYIHERLKQLGKSYELRVMLVQVDIKDPHLILKELAKICILADLTLILAFSAEEAGRYLETYKIFENKPPEAIMEKTEENFMAKFTDCLTRVKSVNKTDCATLLSHFGNLSCVIEASKEDLSLCPGFGPQKAKRLHDMFHEPFRRASSRKRHASGPSSDATR